jgi:hypothetical protein
LEPSYRLKFTDQRLSSDNLFWLFVNCSGQQYALETLI